MLPVRGFREGGEQLFSGVVVKVERVARCDLEKIWAMVTWYGGKVVLGWEEVTHLVSGCHSVENDQQVWSVTPDWVVDSVKAGQRMDEKIYCSRMVLVSGSKRHIHVKSTPSKYSKQENKTSTVDDNLHDTEETSNPLARQKLYFPREAEASNHQVYPISNLEDNGDSFITTPKERLQSITEDVFEESFDQEEESSDLCCGMRKLETSFIGLQLSPDGGDETTVSKVHEGVDKESDPEGSQNKGEIVKKQVKTRRKSVRLQEKKAVSLKGECEKLNRGQGILTAREALKRVDVKINNLSCIITKDTVGSGKYANSDPDLAHESLIDINKVYTNAARDSVKFNRDLFDHDVLDSDHENFEDKSSNNRRRSTRLMSKAKTKEETSNRRRSVRLLIRNGE